MRSLSRRHVLKASGILLAAWSVVRPDRTAKAGPPGPFQPGPVQAQDSAFEQLRRLHLDYMLAWGKPRLRFDINRQMIALNFAVRAQGASDALAMKLGQQSLHAAKLDYAARSGQPYADAAFRVIART